MKQLFPSSTLTITPVLACAVLTVLLAGCAAETNDDQMPASSSSSSSMPAQVTMNSSTTLQKKYADGTFSAMGDYRSPAGPEQVGISLTLKDGVVSAIQFQGKAEKPRSKEYQDKFSAGFQQLVIGKSIDSLALTVVNGASLTPIGFMDALQKIKTQAMAS